MRLTVLCMLSTASLTAFSHAAAARVDRSGPVQPARERAPVQASTPAPAVRHTGPDPAGAAPKGTPPRGSLLNLTV